MTFSGRLDQVIQAASPSDCLPPCTPGGKRAPRATRGGMRVAPDLGLCDQHVRPEPPPRYRLKDEFTLGDRKRHSAARAREFPIFRMTKQNVVRWPVVYDQ